MNSASLVSIESPPLPPCVVTLWRRFSSGLWRVPEGDIQAAYCADTFPKVKVFLHAGRLFVNGGVHFSGPIRAAANCYLLIPADEYRGPEPRRYTYEGREATYRGEVHGALRFRCGQLVCHRRFSHRRFIKLKLRITFFTMDFGS